MKMSNRAKDITFFCLVIFVIVLAIFVLGFAVGKSFAQEIIVTKLTEQEQINKFYTEESVKSEMYFLAMWEYTENMSEQEYANTFLGGVNVFQN